jgi:hypothetical protein
VKALAKTKEDDNIIATVKLIVIAIVASIVIYLAWVVWNAFHKAVVEPTEEVSQTIGSAVSAYNQFIGYISYRIASLGLTFQSGTHPQGLIPRATFDSWVRQLVNGQISARTLWSYFGGFYSLDEVWQIWVMIGTLDVKEYM